MAKYDHFEQLPVWSEAARLYNAVLDLLEAPNLPLSSAFRNQLDRAALSVSNNIAEGFERSTTHELQSFISIARGSAGEVRSMLAVVRDRPRIQLHKSSLQNIIALAESCARQLTAWSASIGALPFEGRRNMNKAERNQRETEQKASAFRKNFLKNLRPEHPLYNSTEARQARGEAID